uniref:Putative conserved membrane protein n=1 Tax=Amblyomma triste TaxID=251400 RepID=A0A023G615_AMBTT
MAAFLYILLLWTATAADAASARTDLSESRSAESGRTFGALLPLTLGLMPFLAPVISKGVFMVLLSGLAYLVLFVGSYFVPGLGGLIGLGTAGLRSFEDDPSENSIDRVARVVRQAIASTEESVTGGTTQCRRRLVCELSKSVSDGVPRVDMFDNYFRNLTGEVDSYVGAWASGWLHRDCARFYKECDRTSVDSLSTIVGLLGGPDGYIGSLLSGFTNTTVIDSPERSTTASWITTSLRNIQSSTPPPFSNPTLRPPLTTIVQQLVTIAATQDLAKLVSSLATSTPSSKEKPPQ